MNMKPHHRVRLTARALSPLWLMMGLAPLLVGWVGCAIPGQAVRAEWAAQDVKLFGPLQLPARFDRQRAEMPLNQIPDDPAVPSKEAEPAPFAELPRQAIRHIESARELFVAQRYSKAMTELEKALRYNASNAETHRMLAMACLLSGNTNRAELHAERTLVVKPDDPVGHYVLARLADKIPDSERALREYRMALKCEPGPDDAPYTLMTRYYLGVLLDQEGYYRAAVHQLKTFEVDFERLSDEAKKHPELAMILRVQRATIPLRIARGYAFLGDYSAAADAMANAAAVSPDDTDLRRDLVAMLARAHRFDDAVAAARTFVADSNNATDAIQLLLAVCRFSGREAQAVAFMKDLVADRPDDVNLALLYTDALFSAGRFAQAADYLNDLIERNPDVPEVRWKLVAIYRSRHDWRAWLKVLAHELSVHPFEVKRADEELASLPEPIAQRMVQAAVDPDATKRVMIPTLRTDRAMAALDYCLARLCDRLGRIEEARALFERSLQRVPGFEPATLGAAELYVQRCRWRDASEVIKAADISDPHLAQALKRLLGQCYDGLDQVDEAIAHYQEALQLDKTDIETMMLLGRLYDRMGFTKQAEAQYRAVIAIRDDHVEARETLVRSLWRRWREQGGLRRLFNELSDFQKITPDDPATVRAYALVRCLVVQPPDYDTYADTLSKILESYPGDLRTRQELAATRFVLGDYDKAEAQVAEVLQHDPCSAEANELKALIFMKRLDLPAAIEQLEKVLTLYPNREGLMNKLVEIRLVEHDTDAAIELWKHLLSLKYAEARHPAYRKRLIMTYVHAKRFDEAYTTAQRWLNEADVDTLDEARRRVLFVDAAADENDRYITRCHQWLEADPKSPLLRSWLVGTQGLGGGLPGAPTGLVRAEWFDEAIALTVQWLAESKNENDVASESAATNLLLNVLQAAKRYDEAIELTRSLLATDGNVEERAEYFDSLRQLYVLADRYDDALEVVQRWTEEEQKSARSPSVFQLKSLLIDTLAASQRYEDVVSHINELIEEADRNQAKAIARLAEEKDTQRQAQLRFYSGQNRRIKGHLLRQLSSIYQRQGRHSLAEDRMREAYEILPTDAGVNNDLGYMLADAGKELDEAERMIRLAVSEVLWDGYGLDPAQPAYMDSLGWVFYQKGQLEEAWFWLSRAADLRDGQDPVIFDHLGDVQWRRGQKKDAVKCWARAMEIHDQRVVQGEAILDDEVADRVKSKWTATKQGQEPDVAAMGSSSKESP